MSVKLIIHGIDVDSLSLEEIRMREGLNHVIGAIRQTSSILLGERFLANGDGSGVSRQIISNACFESSFVNLRNLDDFFRTTRCTPVATGLKKPREDDIFAEEFGFPPQCLLTGETRSKIDKQLAHLTWRRVSDEPLVIQKAELLSYLPLFRKFIHHIATSFLPKHDLVSILMLADVLKNLKLAQENGLYHFTEGA